MIVQGEMIAQAAESRVFSCDFSGYPAVVKHRFSKAYRHPTLDQKIREQRTLREARALVRCRRLGVNTPVVYAVDKGNCTITMERVLGKTVRDVLNGAHAELLVERASSSPARAMQLASDFEALCRQLLAKMGAIIGRLHSGDVIHGDLTTSNFMVREGGDDPVLPLPPATASAAPKAEERRWPVRGLALTIIDFGLVKDSSNAEERAVDIYVLERAIASAHSFLEPLGIEDAIMVGYDMTIDRAKGIQTANRLNAVRARGRKRSMIG